MPAYCPACRAGVLSRHFSVVDLTASRVARFSDLYDVANRPRPPGDNMLPDPNGMATPPTIHEPSATSRDHVQLGANAPHRRARSALRGAVGDAAIGPLDEPGRDGLKWLPHLCGAMLNDLSTGSLKALLFVHLRTMKVSPDGDVESSYKAALNMHRFDSAADIPHRVQQWKDQLQLKLENSANEDYEYVVKGIKELVLTWVRYVPPRAAGFIKAPDWIVQKHCTRNVETHWRNDCFRVSCLVAWHCLRQVNTKRPEVCEKWLLQSELDFAGCEGEVDFEQIGQFEVRNKVRVCVYGVGRDGDSGKEYLYPMRIPEDRSSTEKAIPLLLLEKGGKAHYVAIYRDKLQTFLKRPMEGQTWENCCSGGRQHSCPYCVRTFRSDRVLSAHLENGCKDTLDALLCMPCADAGGNPPVCKHRAADARCGDRSERSPFVVFGDFECETPRGAKTGLRPMPATQKLGKHIPYAWSIKVISTLPDVLPKIYRFHGYDAETASWKQMGEIEEGIKKRMSVKLPLNVTAGDEEAFTQATTCFFCRQAFCEAVDRGSRYTREQNNRHLRAQMYKVKAEMGKMLKENKDASIEEKKGELKKVREEYRLFQESKVRHPCHLTGDFKGAAHNSCNLAHRFGKTVDGEFQMAYKVPFFFHYGKGYDSNFLIRTLHQYDAQPTVIAQNTQKLIAFTAGCFQFKDSMGFMKESLDNLAKTLPDEKLTFLRTHPSIPPGMPEARALELLRDKGVFPYEYVTPARLSETCLPPREAFYSSLYNTAISEADYERAQTVWREFECKTLGDYVDLYCAQDVLLLADIFEAFRDQTKEHFDLDAAHFLTLPNCQWEGLPRGAYQGHERIELPLLTDREMHDMCYAGLRGGMCSVGRKKLARANNPICKGYDKTKAKRWIMYFDANNLYGVAMSKKLPYGDFRWRRNLDLHRVLETVRAYRESDDRACFLEVDMEIPDAFHDGLMDFPPAPEKMQIPPEWLSEDSQAEHQKIYGKAAGKSAEKLVLHLGKKEKYIVHVENLQYYMKLGCEVTKVHRVLDFEQRAWMKPYIDFCTAQRKKAKSEFEKDFWKLCANACFGKTMEDKKGRITYELIADRALALKKASRPTLKDAKIFHEDLVGFLAGRTKVVLDKPIQAGVAVLELSKLHMYRWFYDVARDMWPDCELLYGDTDSLILEVGTEDVYADMKARADEFDFSDYPKEHPDYSEVNKKKPGKFKDECESIPINLFVALKVKTYSAILEWRNKKGKLHKVAAKGNPKRMHDEATAMAFTGYLNEKGPDLEFQKIGSSDFEVYTWAMGKLGYHNYDDKRFYMGHEALPHGHVRAREMCAMAEEERSAKRQRL